MTGNLLYSYAVAKSFYEQTGDYIDAFCIFVLRVLPSNKTFLDFDTIQKKVKDFYGLFIPEFSLQAIITRTKRRGFVTQKGDYVALTDEANTYLDSLEREDEVTRRINKLLEHLKVHLGDARLRLEDVYKILLCFITDNFEPVIEFFNPTDKCSLAVPTKINKYEDRLAKYFEIINQSEPDLYQTLQDLVYGSIISLSLVCSNIAEINKKFKDVKIFLDSNIIFSLFELHYPEVDKPVKELFDLLRRNKLSLKVFDFTIQEMVYVLGNFAREQHMYIPGIKVNSIYSNLKDKGWTTEDVREFIQKIEEKIWNLGVEIYPTDINLNTYLPSKEYIDKIQNYKPLQLHQTTDIYKHDLAVIDKVREIRIGSKRELERSSAFFLTSDLRLSKFDFIELRHKFDFTICEIIPDRLLTNILWLKSPHMIRDVSLNSIISIHSKGTFIDQKIWKRFYYNVKKLKQEKNISDQDISTLFYGGNINELLRGVEEPEITPVFIEEGIRQVSERIDQETKKQIENQKVYFEELIANEVDKQKKWEGMVRAFKNKIEGKSRSNAEFITKIELVLFYAILVILFFVVWNALFRMVVLATSLFGVLSFFGVKFDFARIKERSVLQKFNYLYRKNLRLFDFNGVSEP